MKTGQPESEAVSTATAPGTETDEPHHCTGETRRIVRAVVTIHGIGPGGSGKPEQTVASGLTRDLESARYAPTIVAPDYYSRVSRISPAAPQPADEIYHVSWHDVGRPATGSFRQILNFAALMGTAFRVSEKWDGIFATPIGNSRFATLLTGYARIVLLELLAPAVFLYVLFQLAFVSLQGESKWLRIGLTAGGAIACVVVAYVSRSWSRYISISAGLCALTIIASAGILWNPSGDFQKSVINMTGMLCKFLFLVWWLFAGLSGVRAIFAAAIAERQFRYPLTRASFAILPVLCLGGLGGLLAVALTQFFHAKYKSSYDLWENAFFIETSGRIELLRLALAIAVAITACIAVAAIISAVIYFTRAHRYKHPPITAISSNKRSAHAAVVFIDCLIWILCLSAVTGAALIFLQWVRPFFTQYFPKTNMAIAGVGAATAAIAAALYKWNTGTQTLIDAVGDIVYYVTPSSEKMRAEVRKRLRVLIENIQQQLPNVPGELSVIAIVGHSQGTVIAADVLYELLLNKSKEERAGYHLITTGSPLSQLYGRYLGPRYADPNKISPAITAPQCTWDNLYKEGDYIASPIEGDSFGGNSTGGLREDELIDAGAHSGYWDHKRTTQRLH